MMSYNEEKERSNIENRLEKSRERCLGINNLGIVRGMVLEEIKLSHEYMGVKYYKTKLEVFRPNIDNKDCVPIIISEKLIPEIFEKIKKMEIIEVYGEFRSHNKIGNDGKTHVELFMYAREINYDSDKEDANCIYLRGFVCKDVIFRETPSGYKIADMILAVNRLGYKSDYIPCVVWWKNAEKSRFYKIGQEVKVFGRIQSRVYSKQLEGSEERIFKEAYEVSISLLEEV